MSSLSTIPPLQIVQPPKISPYLMEIVDKKVSGIALSCFEGFVHWFLTTFSCFYPSYQKFFETALERVTQQIAQLSSPNCYETALEQVAQQTAQPSSPIAALIIHHFSSGVPLHDRTVGLNVSIYPNSDTLLMNGKEVAFNEWGATEIGEFHFPEYTENVVVSNVPNRPGVFQIKINLVSSQFGADKPYLTERVFLVDTHKSYVRNSTHYNGQKISTPIYVTESVIAQGIEASDIEAVKAQIG